MCGSHGANGTSVLPAFTPAFFQIQVYDSRALSAADAWAQGNLYAGVSPIFQATPQAAVFAPLDCRLSAVGAGVVQITAAYYEDGANRADEWSIAYTINGSDPTADHPGATAELSASGLAVLTYLLPAVANGTTVKVRLQTRRNDGTELESSWVYSADSTVESLLVDVAGPSAPLVADRWPGLLPTEQE